MSIPRNVTDELAVLQAQVAAALPLTSANRATVKALKLNAASLVADVSAAQLTLAGLLDTWTANSEPVDMINGILGLLGNAQDEAAIVLMRGLVGRVASNLNQLPG